MDTQDEFQNLVGRIILRACANGFDPQRRVGLSALELRVLVKLVFEGPTCMRDLGADLSLPRSTIPHSSVSMISYLCRALRFSAIFR